MLNWSLYAETQCIACRIVDTSTTPLDRKSTRLNSSHVETSYPVFCLKKKPPPLQHLPKCTGSCGLRRFEARSGRRASRRLGPQPMCHAVEQALGPSCRMPLDCEHAEG